MLVTMFQLLKAPAATRMPYNPKQLRPRQPALVRAAATEGKSLKRSLSAHSRCEIASPDGMTCYCNVIRGASNDAGEEGFQFVVVFMKDNEVLESSEYEYYKSEWFPTIDACQAAIDSFDIKEHLPQLAT